jgi:hypothetical protein
LTAVKERRNAPRHPKGGGDMTKQQETEEVYR